jgi:predicted dehydrogenase
VAAIPGARVVAVYGPTRQRAEAVAQASGAAAFDDLDRFFEIPVDMVAIGTPSGLHGAHGAAAIRHGAHVLVEKPIEISTARADALIADADRAGVTLGVIFQDRLKPDVRRLKSRVEEGTLGTILLARAQVPWWRPPEYYRDSRWRGTWALDGGGALMNQGVHTVDLLLWLCGPVARVSGRTATRFHKIEVEDTAVAVLEFASGALATLEASTCVNPGRPRRIEIAGSRGTAILEGDELIPGDGRPAGPPPINVASPVVADASSHRDVITDFMRAVRDGGRPCCDGREGRRSVALVEAIYQSSRTGLPVDVGQ